MRNIIAPGPHDDGAAEIHTADTRPPEPITFPGCPTTTLGVELEISLLDPATGALAPRASEVLAAADSPSFKAELFQSIIEINTRVCDTVADVRRDLTGKLTELHRICDNLGLACMCIGTHPTADWSAVPITEGERYLNLVDSMQWPARRLLICGLHVHVGAKSGEHAIALLDSLTVFIPHLVALSASSPFWAGQDTGLASSRIKVFEGLPTAGLPPEVTNWSEFVALMRTLRAAGSIRSIREIWWDVRPHPGFGTVEMRACDGVNTLTEICALTAFSQSLVSYLQDLYDHGEPVPMLRNWTLRENKWRACRNGLDASLIRNERGSQVPLHEHIFQWIDLLGPTAARLGCADELADVAKIFTHRPSFERQRRALAETGSFDEVIATVTEEFRHDRPYGA